MRPLSLRTKLVFTLAAIVTIVSCPLVYFAYSDTVARSVAAAEDKFEKITQILEEDIGLSYLNGQTLVNEKVAIEKDDIIEMLNEIETAIGEGEFKDFHEILGFTSRAWGTETAVVSEWGEYLYLSPLARRMIRQNADDVFGVPFKEYLRNEGGNFYRDYFTFIRLKAGDKENVPFLVAVRKITGYTVIVMQNLDYLESQAPEHARVLEGRLRDTVRSLGVSDSTDVCIWTGDGRVVAAKGPSAQSLPASASPEDLKAARAGERVVRIASRGGVEALSSIQYVKALDWYLHASVPMSWIKGPAEAYALKLAGIVVLVSWVVGLFGLLMVTWFLKPLRRVSAAAGRLEAFDFVKGDTARRLRAIVDGLPQHQRDEIGQVSRAFSSMVVALEKNIEDLKESLARQHSIEGELNAAHEIQLGMLPDASGGFHAEGMEAAALMHAAKEVGGDFYDVFELPGEREALILGDVSGKGVSAALFMCVTLTLARNAVKDGLGPAEAMRKVNDHLAANNPNCMFVTLWMGILDRRTGRLAYANGGHCPPCVLSRSPGVPEKWLRDVSGPLVGPFEDVDYAELETTLEPGDVVFVYSDGVTEAMNEGRELFGEERMSKVFDACRGERPQAFVTAMTDAIAAHRGAAEQSDDITMLVFEFKPEDRNNGGAR